MSGQWHSGLLKANVEIPEGDYAPEIGLSYSQLSRIGYGMHKSQNGGTGVPEPEPFASGYYRFASRVSTQDDEGFVFHRD